MPADLTTAIANTHPNPSDAQRAAGNYRKGKINFHGLTISIETPKGQKRKPEWKPLAAHYGYVNRTEGKDGDAVDVFLGPKLDSEIVFVVDQVTPGGRFDEHKCVLGVTSKKRAKQLYLANYPSGWKCGPITAMTIEQFKAWLAKGETTRRVAEQVSRYDKTAGEGFESRNSRLSPEERASHRQKAEKQAQQSADALNPPGWAEFRQQRKLSGMEKLDKLDSAASVLQGVQLDTSQAAPASLPTGGVDLPGGDGSPSASGRPPQVGDTTTIGSRTYRFNQNHRWERADRDDAAQGGAAGHPPEQPGQAPAPNPANDQSARNKFTQSRLGTVHPELGGLMRAIHESPHFQQSGEYASFDVHQRVAADLHHSLSIRAGQEFGGGQVVDLGEGRVGFSSEAGAIVVWPADERGKHRISYTNKTGVVGKAMAKGGQKDDVSSDGSERAAGRGEIPGVGESEQPASGGASPQNSPPGAGGRAPGGGSVPEPVPPPRPGIPRGKPVEQPQQPAPGGKRPDEQAYDRELTPPKEKPAHVRLRARANQSKQRMEAALAEYEQAVEDRERPDRIRKLRQRFSDYRQVYNEHHRQATRAEAGHKARLKESGKSTKERMKQLGIGPFKPKPKAEKPAKPAKEPKQPTTMPDDSSKLTRSFSAGNNRGTIEFENDQHRDLYDLGAKHSYVTRGGRNKTSDRHVGDIKALTAKLAESTGMSEQELRGHAAEVFKHTKAQMKGLGDGEHRAVKMPTAKDTAPLVDHAEKNPGKGDVPEATPEAMEAAKEMGKLPGESQRAGAAAQTYLRLSGLTESPENLKAVQHAIRRGWIKNKQEMRVVLKRAKQFHDRSGSHKYSELRGIKDKAQRSAKRAELASSDHHALKDAIRRKANRERRESWAAIVKEQAAAWDMTPKEYHDEASKIYKEFVAPYAERENVKNSLRNLLKVNARKVRQIEERGGKGGKGGDYSTLTGMDEAARYLQEHVPHLIEDENPELTAWNLLKEGRKPVPGKTSQEFTDHMGKFLQANLQGAGSGFSADEIAEMERQNAATPFAKVRMGVVERYWKWRSAC